MSYLNHDDVKVLNAGNILSGNSNLFCDVCNFLGQCAPMPPPPQGSFTLVAGNGTSVGTVMTLVCSHRHRPISGGLISCVQESNGTQWRGGNPECKRETCTNHKTQFTY